LPLGKHVFVATSFSDTNDEVKGGYCTNNPNIDVSVGGPGLGRTTPTVPVPSDSSTSPGDGKSKGRASRFWDGVRNFFKSVPPTVAPGPVGPALPLLTEDAQEATKGHLDAQKEFDSWRSFDGDSGDVSEEATEYYRRRNLKFKERVKEKQAEEQ
jgi:hypothetical protein